MDFGNYTGYIRSGPPCSGHTHDARPPQTKDSGSSERGYGWLYLTPPVAADR